MTKRIEVMSTSTLMAYLAPKHKIDGLMFEEGEEDEVVLVFDSIGNDFMLVIEGEAEALIEAFNHEPQYMQEIPRF